MDDIKLCDKCHKPCQFLECTVKPEAAEWYCPDCHKSYWAREKHINKVA